MVYFKPTSKLTDEEKRMVSDMVGKLQLYILEGRSIVYMAKQTHLSIYEVEENLFETAYQFIKQIGWRKFIKLLIYKR